jgi:hypothetical protein
MGVGFQSSGFYQFLKNDFILRVNRTAFGSREWYYPNFYGLDTYASIPYKFEHSIQPHF